jgi:uncharacterized protein (UPF0218 family)
MAVIPNKIKITLKKPLGRLHPSPSFLRKTKRRIISVGDESTLVMLENGIKPHLAVFDFKIKRKKITKSKMRILLSSFGKIMRYKNKKGTLSDYLLRNAGELMKKGGAILIDGEEDLTALAFILEGGKKDIVVYGQPDKGLVSVKPEKAKRRVLKILTGSTLGHKVKRH